MRRFVVGEIKFAEIPGSDEGMNTPAGPDAPISPTKLLRTLLVSIVNAADAVCTTPHASWDRPYKAFNEASDAAILDEAGAMCKADALIVWGTQCRPCVMAGDEKQLAPLIMNPNRNRFAAEGRTSILEHLKRSGYPCLILTEQLRIVSGMFDLAKEIIYHQVKNFAYGERAQLANHPIARKIDAWVRAKYELQSLPGKVLPTFLHCPDSKVQQAPGGSRFNLVQNAVAVDLIVELLGSGIGLQPEDIVMITPYRANLDLLEKSLQQHAVQGLEKVTVNTTDSFQGREGQVAVLVLCIDKQTGPSFTASPQRICVGITRQIGALFVVGDINTVAPIGTIKPTEVRGDDCEVVTIKMDVFRSFLQYFRDHSRVVTANFDDHHVF